MSKIFKKLKANAGKKANLKAYFDGVERWGACELEALEMPCPEGGMRVVVIRHGMGDHNNLASFGFLKRDTELNVTGIEESQFSGQLLRTAGFFENLDLIVVSPFRRTLNTALNVLSEDFESFASSNKILVQPLCAEHTLDHGLPGKLGHVIKSDRGTISSELKEQFPQFDFSPIAKYCKERSIEGGRWWTHAAGRDFETKKSFGERAAKLRVWLGSQAKKGIKKCLIVAHGGILEKTFGNGKIVSSYHNCEFRAFDVFEDGTFIRVSSQGWEHCRTNNVESITETLAHVDDSYLEHREGWVHLFRTKQLSNIWKEYKITCDRKKHQLSYVSKQHGLKILNITSKTCVGHKTPTEHDKSEDDVQFKVTFEDFSNRSYIFRAVTPLDKLYWMKIIKGTILDAKNNSFEAEEEKEEIKITGNLLKKSGNDLFFTRRRFVLSNRHKTLSYYSDHEEGSVSFPISKSTMILTLPVKKQKNFFKKIGHFFSGKKGIQRSTNLYTFVIKNHVSLTNEINRKSAKKNEWILRTDSPGNRDLWVNAIKKVILDEREKERKPNQSNSMEVPKENDEGPKFMIKDATRFGVESDEIESPDVYSNETIKSSLNDKD